MTVTSSPAFVALCHEAGATSLLRRAGHLLARWVLLACALGIVSSGSFADEPTSPTTIVVFGDSQAAGLARGLQRVLINNARYRVINRTHPGASFAHPENEWLTPIQHFVETEKADVAIVMFGGNDRIDMRDDKLGDLHFRTDIWRETYAKVIVDRV